MGEGRLKAQGLRLGHNYIKEFQEKGDGGGVVSDVLEFVVF